MKYSCQLLWTLLACLPALLTCRNVLIIAGNFSLNGALANIAEYDYDSGVWLHNYEPGLYLYGASNGVILDIVKSDDKAYLVGAFDSDAQTSQVAYCSVGEWNGNEFSKVGEGLCPRGADSASAAPIRSVVLANGGDLMVGGSFHARVWNGIANSFVDVYDLALYNHQNGWLPLVENSLLKCISTPTCVPGVYSLAWDAGSSVLYIGGIFDSLNDNPITPSLCQWTADGGIKAFEGGGLSNKPNNSVYTQAVSIAFEEKSESLVVGGNFYYAGGQSCQNIAIWNRRSSTWRCLYQASVSFAVISAMHLDPASMDLFAAGWASDRSSWNGNKWGCPYAAGKTNIRSLLPAKNKHVNGSSNRYMSGKSPEGERKLRYESSRDDSSSVVSWNWLSGFPGGNGPIFRFLPIPDTDQVVIGGAFNNFHAVVIWFSGNSSTLPLHSGALLNGDVAALTMMNIPTGTKSKGTHSVEFNYQRLYFAITASAILIIVIGMAFFVGFRTKIEYENIMSEAEANESDDFAVDIDMTSISLNALTGGMKSKIDIEQCFENAMRSRHVRFRDTLRSIQSEDINLTRIIGEGSYGRVWAGRWRNEPVAVKEFVFAQTALLGGSLQTSELIEEIIGEAGIMSLLKHPKILQLYGVSLTTQTIWIISELCATGSLRMLLNNHSKELSFLTRLSLCLDIAEGLNYLHSRRPPIIHRDLKSHNIFINEFSPGMFTAKIGDWGSARAIAASGAMDSMTQGVGTTCWLAPEVIEFAHASVASDTYAFGIILWEIMTGKEVFVGLTANQIIARVVKFGLRPAVSEDCPLRDLMQACWAQNPGDRPNFIDIVNTLRDLYNIEADRYDEKTQR